MFFWQTERLAMDGDGQSFVLPGTVLNRIINPRRAASLVGHGRNRATDQFEVQPTPSSAHFSDKNFRNSEVLTISSSTRPSFRSAASARE